MHRTLEVETQPFLNAPHAASLCKIEEQYQVEYNRCSENAVAAQEINLDLHGITEPPVYVNVIPPFFIIPSRRVIVDPHLVREILIEFRIQLRLEDRIQDGQLAFFLGLEGLGVIEDLAVAISKDVRREPSIQAQHPCLQSRR